MPPILHTVKDIPRQGVHPGENRLLSLKPERSMGFFKHIEICLEITFFATRREKERPRHLKDERI